MTTDQTTPQDPTEQYPGGEMPEREQEQNVGIEARMQVQPDYGEDTYKGFGRLEGKVAIITGGDSGIGRAVAVAFSREGADVVLSYLPQEEQDAQLVKRVVEAAGRKAVLVPGDIGDESVCARIVQTAADELGSVDVLVNNAAYQASHEDIQEWTSEEFEHTFRTNVFATFYLSKAALQLMQPGSTIINTSSIQAYNPSPSLLAYAATKGAIVNLTKAMAQQAIQKGIRVNSVAPGPVWTPLIAATMPEEQVKQFGSDSPMQRPAQPAELAPSYVFLASQESSYVNGEVLGVTGGSPMP